MNLNTHELDLGPLSVRTWAGLSEPVLAIHGISSNNLLWQWLHDVAPELTLIAPDLAGRGESPAPEGESSVRRHADHLVQLLDDLSLGPVHLLGMSMGGFVATAMAAAYPERVTSVTLVDGGLPLPAMVGVPEDALRQRLDDTYRDETEWESATAFLESYVARVAPLTSPDDPRMLALVAHGLSGGETGGVQRLDLRTLISDGFQIFASDEPQMTLNQVQAPMRLAYAQWSIGADSAPMYPADQIDDTRRNTPRLVQTVAVEGVDHASIIMTEHGARVCAELLRRTLPSGEDRSDEPADAKR